MIENAIKIRFIYFLYRLALILAAPPLILYFVLRIRRDHRYAAHFRERLGTIPFPTQPTAAGTIWLHAVSVGEVISSIALLRTLRETFPTAPLFVSVGTIAGRAIAGEKLAALTNGIFYVPLDYVGCIRRVLRKLKPSLVVVMETEIWPNLYRETRRCGARLAIVNGRISDRAFPRYQRFRFITSAALSQPHEIFVQTPQDRARYLDLGAPAARLHAEGNLKYDFDPSEGEIAPEIRRYIDDLQPSRIWIAASTMPPREDTDPDEDDIVVAAIQQLAATHPRLLTILVPRRPERFAGATEKLERAGVPFLRRSQIGLAPAPALPSVLLLDSMGELSRLFSLADVVFMGGTFPQRGGHNILEPAYFGKPIVAGPHMENFPAIAEEFTRAGAMVRVAGPRDLAPAIARLLDDDAERTVIGERARQLAIAKRGVTRHIASRLAELYRDAIPRSPTRPLLAPFAALWEYETRRRRERALASQRKLEQPVISIGNISMGGSGKTPFTDWLATRLKDRGLQPAILTRGYRRRSPEPYVVLHAGTETPAELTGDEPQTYLKHGSAHLGIGADRYEAGRLLSKIYPSDVMLLDDGFQHWRLARDIDIVLIDGLDPFGGGAVFPQGRLREPLSSLARASAFLITRAGPGVRIETIERELRRWNPHAPIFTSRVKPHGWIRLGDNQIFEDPPFQSAGAFCGLANPNTFWRTLDEAGIETPFRWSFGDHHRYHPPELRKLAVRTRRRGAEVLLTTQKDVPNLPVNILELVAPTPVFALEITIEVDRADELLEWIYSGFLCVKK